jgi:alpha-tubulin suppressor-like RCC1 family protein
VEAPFPAEEAGRQGLSFRIVPPGTSRVRHAGLAALIAVAGLLAGCTPLTAAQPGSTSAARSPASASASASRAVAPVYSLPTPPAGFGGGTTAIRHWGTFFGTAGGLQDTLTSPIAVQLPGTVAEVGSSNSTQYALLTNGSLYAWGLGNAGQLGDGSTQSSFGTPVRVRFPPGVKIASIPTDAMPYDTGLAVDTTGHAWGWGDNGYGDLCLGTSTAHPTPVRLPFGLVSAVTGASNHALYDSDGVLYACGQNLDGDLGDASIASTTRPVRVAGLPGYAVTTLVASFANSGALLADGQYYDWGYNAAGQLGDGRLGPSSDVPVAVSLPLPVREVALGGSLWNNGQTFVMLTSGAVWAWGNDDFCQLGTGAFGDQADPLRVYPPAGVSYQSLATGSGTGYAISTTGNVYAWGVSHVGQVGNGGTQTMCTPVQIASHATQISSTADDAVITVGARS